MLIAGVVRLASTHRYGRVCPRRRRPIRRARYVLGLSEGGLWFAAAKPRQLDRVNGGCA
jgi:hypothetical protein